MIVETEVKMVINQYNIEYYRLLGYEVHKSFDDKLPNDEIILQKILDAKILMSRQNLLNYTISFTS